MLNVCADCTTSYAPDLTLCPHCGSERRSLEETDPYRGGTEPMPKITRHGGPSIAGGWSAGEHEADDAASGAAEAAAEPVAAPDDSDAPEHADTEPEAPEPPTELADPTNAEIRQWAGENGYEVAESGKIPRAVREAYDAAHAA